MDIRELDLRLDHGEKINDEELGFMLRFYRNLTMMLEALGEEWFLATHMARMKLHTLENIETSRRLQNRFASE